MKLGVPLQYKKHKKTDSELVREGTVKSARIYRGWKDLEMRIYKHLTLINNKVLLYHGSTR
jgi:hypothetical protein